MSLDKLKQTLSELQKNNTPTQTVWVEVKEVDWDEKTMVALGIDDELEYYDVLLGLGSVNVKPKVGSNCLIGFINNSETLPFLIMADEVEEIDVNVDKCQFNINDGFFLKKQKIIRRLCSCQYFMFHLKTLLVAEWLKKSEVILKN